MILELQVRDFAIIDEARIELAPGLNVLTGETGAGKSIVVDAVGLLLGDRADTTMVRAGADRALVQGVFDLAAGTGALEALLTEIGVEPSGELIVDREVHAAGRSVARVNGRAVNVKVLAEIARHLVDLHGQSDTASLKREVEHLDLLDRFGELMGQRDELASAVDRHASVMREISRLGTDAAATARRQDMLAFQVEEIAQAKLTPGEEEQLVAERTRLANAERLATLANDAYRALTGLDDEAGASDLAEAAAATLADLGRIDGAMDGVRESVLAAALGLADAAHAIRDYRDRLEFNPERLEEVETRLARLGELKRKYGATVDEVIAFAAAAVSELEKLATREDRSAALSAEAETLAATIGQLAGALSSARDDAGRRLGEAVTAELESVGLPGSIFKVDITQRADPAGVPVGDAGRPAITYAFDRTGIDAARFLVSTNPGEPPRPLAKVASGGEAARLMLALKTVLGAVDSIATLIFDEIDAGIGGRVGSVVGRKLWRLSAGHQVICVTHLPQVAAFADAHILVRKVVAGGRTVTKLARLAEADRAEELMHMLGTAHEPGRASAERLLEEATEWKREAQPVSVGG